MSKFLVVMCWCFFSLFANLEYDYFIKMQENAQGIPSFLLRAISNVESGRLMGGAISPWPWTINVEGKGYVFETKQKAISAVQKFQRMGAKSIDIGIMQINLRHHPYAFRNLEEAFDPQLNIAYGAKFLKQLFLQHKSWDSAIGHYHSATPKFHNAYKQRVLKHWTRLTNNKMGMPRFEKAVMKFDDVESVVKEPKVVKKETHEEIRPFARVKKIYYSLDAGVPSHSMNAEKTSYALDNASNKQYYSLD